MPISASEIAAVVTKEDDFGHEMRVGQIIQTIPAIELRHGGTYTDSVSGKPRQFDYRCSLRKEAHKLLLAVECKNLSPSLPLAICGTNRRSDEAYHDLIDSRIGVFKRGSQTISGRSSVTLRANGKDSFYLEGGFAGKSLIRIQTDKKPPVRIQDSDVYDKWAQALSSAVELANSACDSAKSISKNHLFTAVLPVVVVPDDLLWRVIYDEKGDVATAPAQVTECELYVGRKITVGHPEMPQWFTFSHVHFFTNNGFSSFLSKMAMNDRAWFQLFAEGAAEI